MTLRSPYAPLEVVVIDEPCPAPLDRAQRRTELFKTLMEMPMDGKGVEINRKPSTMRFYASRLRKTHAGVRFMVRDSQPGWCRIWRVA